MQVVVGAGHFHLPVAEATQAAGDAGHIGGNHAGVAHQYHVCLEQLFVLLAKAIQTGRADFLFAFKHELHIAGQLVRLHHKLESFGLHKALTLVVVGAARPYLAVFHHRLERLGLPQLEGCHGHHVIVAIHQHGRLGGVDGFLAIHHRIASRRHHFSLVAAGLQQKRFPLLGTAHHIGFVFALGTDRGDANQFE